MKKLKIGKSDIHGKGLFTGEPIRKGDLIAKVHSGIQLDPETVKYMPTQYGRFYNHDEKKFNTTNEIIGNHRYLRAIKNIPANTELTANYREHSDMEQPENFGQGKYASFDFDKTIATDEGLAKARQMLKDGYNLFIVSARDKVTPDMVARARKAGIPEENIIATGSDEAKVRKVKQLGVEKHFDDKPEVIAALGLVGEQFKKGGGLNSKKYTRSITGTNKLFTKNNLFKKKSTKRIYDPNAKYFDNGGINKLEGDLISKVLMERNRGVDFVDRAFALGDNPGTPMFNLPDDEQFGQNMSHKMAWGEDDNGQAWMYPTVMNPNDEAIQVPNQYADYISSEGYKNATGMNQHKAGGASEQKIIFSPREGGCPEGQYWTGTECKIIPKNTKIVYSEEELAKSNISKKEQQKLYNQYISRVNNHNTYEAAVLKKYGKIGAKDKYYKTFESIPKHGWDPWMSYGSGKLMPPKDGIPYINEQMVPFKQWKKMMDKSSVKPIGFKGHPGGGHFYPVYEKPSNYLLGYNKEEEPIIPINPIKEEVIDPIKETEVIVPTSTPTPIPDVPLVESVGIQDYPEELKGTDWEWDRKYHSFTTPRLNKHFPLGPLFNGKKKHTFSTPYLHRRKDYEDGGIIADFSRDQIQEYINGGYIVEELDNYANGGGPTDCGEGMVWSDELQDCVKSTVQAVDQVRTNQYSPYAVKYDQMHPQEREILQKKAEYLSKHKGLNRIAGVTQDNFPEKVLRNIINQVDYERNNYIIDQYSKAKGFNPNKHVQLVENIAEKGRKSYDMAQNSKYGSKLKPSLWARTLAGAQELGNFVVKQLPGTQGDVFKYEVPGLSKKERKEIANSKTGALETFAVGNLPGQAIANTVLEYGKTLTGGTGADYQTKDIPNVLSGEYMPGVDDNIATVFNPLTYTGLTTGLMGAPNMIRSALPMAKNIFTKGKTIVNSVPETIMGSNYVSGFNKIKPGINKFGQNKILLDKDLVETAGQLPEQLVQRTIKDFTKPIKTKKNFNNTGIIIGEDNANIIKTTDALRKEFKGDLYRLNKLKAENPGINLEHPSLTGYHFTKDQIKKIPDFLKGVEQNKKSTASFANYFEKQYADKMALINKGNDVFQNIVKESPQYIDDIAAHLKNPTKSNEDFLNDLVIKSNTYARFQNNSKISDGIRGSSIGRKGYTMDVEGIAPSDYYGAQGFRIQPTEDRVWDILNTPLAEKWSKRIPEFKSDIVLHSDGMHHGFNPKYRNFLDKRLDRLDANMGQTESVRNTGWSDFQSWGGADNNINYQTESLIPDYITNSKYFREPRHLVFESPTYNAPLENFQSIPMGELEGLGKLKGIGDLDYSRFFEGTGKGFKYGGLNEFAGGGGASSCPKDHVWDSNTKKCVKVYTLANDQKLIDGVSNWAMHSSNPDKVSSEYNDQIKHYLYSGKYGYDPVSGTLYPLKKEQKTVADAETKKILAKQDDKAAYTQSIIDAGFDPDTFGKSKGTNVITGEEIYGDKSQEDVDKINKEAVNNFVTEGHRQAILESPFNIAANFTPMGMAAGVMQGAANLLPDVYDFAKDPSWSGAGAVGMDALMMAPAGKGIGKFLGTKSGLLSNTSKINPWAGTFEGESLLPKGLQFNKLDDPEAFYRLTKDPKNYGLGVDSYFNKGVPLTGDLANTFPKESRAFGHRYSGPKYNQQTGKIDEYFGKDYLFKVKDESLMKPFLNFPEEHLTFYQQAKEINPGSSQHFQKDWLKGWTQIPQNKHGGLHKFIDGGEPCPDGYTWDETKQDCVSLIDTDWLSNWYANRKLPLDEIPNKKYVNLMRERLPQYNPESTLLEELSNLPPVEYQDVIDDDPNNQGQLTYDKKYNPDKILLKKSLLDDPVRLNQIYNSEASTAVDVNKPGLFAAQNMVIDPGLVLFEDRWGDLKGSDRDVAEDHYNYTTDPEQDNIHSLIFEERYKRNLKPDQVLTETDINKWKSEAEASGALDRNSPNFDDTLYTLFKLAKDNKSLMNWFNQLASNDKPKTGDEPQYTKQGGSIGYKIGDEIDEATMRKLKKLGYKFQKA